MTEGTEKERFCDLPKMAQQQWKPSQAAKPRPLLLTHRSTKLSQEIRKIKVLLMPSPIPSPEPIERKSKHTSPISCTADRVV